MPAPQVSPDLFSGLQWRNIGPFHGGRIAAVSGAIGQPGVFYAGLPLGGVWKTTSAGVTWTPIMDSVKEASSVGAVEVAPSDPNVIYVGMGDMITGGGITADGEHWEPARGEFLVPVHLLSRKIAAQFCAALKAEAPAVFARIPAQVWRRKWVSFCKHYGQGNDAVLSYLSRYVFRTAMRAACS